MKTYFYDRTAYRLSEQPVPPFFAKLDDFFDTHLVFDHPGVTPLPVLLAESLCGRMADVEMFAFLMEDTRKRHRADKEGETKVTILTHSFFIAYLGASRAVLDCGAAALSIFYNLALKPGERSVSNSEFWQRLVEHAPNVHRRYHGMRIFFNEVFRWCNETVDRVPPLQVLYNQFGNYSSRDSHLRVIDDTHANIMQLGSAVQSASTPQAGANPIVNWVDVLHLHGRWKPQMLNFCEKICQDIEANV